VHFPSNNCAPVIQEFAACWGLCLSCPSWCLPKCHVSVPKASPCKALCQPKASPCQGHFWHRHPAIFLLTLVPAGVDCERTAYTADLMAIVVAKNVMQLADEAARGNGSANPLQRVKLKEFPGVGGPLPVQACMAFLLIWLGCLLACMVRVHNCVSTARLHLSKAI